MIKKKKEKILSRPRERERAKKIQTKVQPTFWGQRLWLTFISAQPVEKVFFLCHYFFSIRRTLKHLPCNLSDCRKVSIIKGYEISKNHETKQQELHVQMN